MKWLMIPIVVIVYVLSFNEVAKKYFASETTMKWQDLYREYIPAMKVTIEL
jgi:hypothetical protein